VPLAPPLPSGPYWDASKAQRAEELATRAPAHNFTQDGLGEVNTQFGKGQLGADDAHMTQTFVPGIQFLLELTLCGVVKTGLIEQRDLIV